MARRAFRPLPEAYVLYSLQVLALAGMHYRTPFGARFNLVTILIALTAAGKETANGALIELSRRIGRSDHISNEPRSDKDIQLALLETDAAIAFVIDEAQRWFGAVSNKNAATSIAAMVDVLMGVITAETWIFPAKMKRDLSGPLHSELKGIASKLGKDDIEPEERDTLISRKGKLERMLQMLKEGIPYPFVSLAASSTPESIDKVILRGEHREGAYRSRIGPQGVLTAPPAI